MFITISTLVFHKQLDLKKAELKLKTKYTMSVPDNCVEMSAHAGDITHSIEGLTAFLLIPASDHGVEVFPA